MTSPSKPRKLKPHEAYIYFVYLWLNTGSYWNLRVLKVARLTMEPVEEYMVMYNHSMGCYESCDCPGYTMHHKKQGKGAMEHKHIAIAHHWMRRGRPLFEAYTYTPSGVGVCRLLPEPVKPT